ncbi:hypothetical protein [Amycolatopsis sp. NPDC058986]|uniref:hypothetical protein n=1 Tax=unclassified Amycolatopsis TaxID=2618356 RepID=UPI0036722359
MSPGMKVAAAVIGGYILGRRKKAKLAIAMGLGLAGKKLNLSPRKLLADVTGELGSSEQFAELKGQVREQVLDAGKKMAVTMAAAQAGRMAGSLRQHTDRLNALQSGIGLGDDEDSQEDTDEETPESEEETDAGKPRRAGRSGPAKAATSAVKRTTGSRATAAKRAGTAKSPSSARKSTGTKSAAAKGGGARKTSSRSGSGGSQAKRR